MHCRKFLAVFRIFENKYRKFKALQISSLWLKVKKKNKPKLLKLLLCTWDISKPSKINNDLVYENAVAMAAYFPKNETIITFSVFPFLLVLCVLSEAHTEDCLHIIFLFYINLVLQHSWHFLISACKLHQILYPKAHILILKLFIT